MYTIILEVIVEVITYSINSFPTERNVMMTRYDTTAAQEVIDNYRQYKTKDKKQQTKRPTRILNFVFVTARMLTELRAAAAMQPYFMY